MTCLFLLPRVCAVSLFVFVLCLYATAVDGSNETTLSCAFESVAESYASCHKGLNATTTAAAADNGDPCQACSVQTTASLLQYADYHRSFTAVDGDSICEPAVAWICPKQDGGQCCVVKESYSATHPHRRLCGQQMVAPENEVRFDEATVANAIAGQPLVTPQLLEIGSAFYMRGQWMWEPNYTILFTFSPGAEHSLVFDRLNRRASFEQTAADTEEKSTIAASELVVLRDVEVFDLTVRFQWKRWDV